MQKMSVKEGLGAFENDSNSLLQKVLEDLKISKNFNLKSFINTEKKRSPKGYFRDSRASNSKQKCCRLNSWSNTSAYSKLKPQIREVSQHSESKKHASCGSFIQTCVRLRPVHKDELNAGASFVITDKNQLSIPSAKNSENNFSLKLDHILPADSSQIDVWKIVKPCIDRFFSGFSTTIFTHGQTGTGKTFTMLGPDIMELGYNYETPNLPYWSDTLGRLIKQVNIINLWKSKAQDPSLKRCAQKRIENAFKCSDKLLESQSKGIIPRVCEELFRMIELEFGNKRELVKVFVSYIQIYNEKFLDLLNPCDEKQNKMNLHTRQNHSSLNHANGLQAVEVKSTSDMMKLLLEGSFNRTYRQTKQNKMSSRSHTIFQVELRQSTVEDGLCKVSFLNLVDLAGNEKCNHKWSPGRAHIIEMGSINKSLSALSLCVDQLSKGEPLVSYRNSKLTHLLQDSLGGNCYTVFIFTISPSLLCLRETLTTLRLAVKAKNVKNYEKICKVISSIKNVNYFKDEVRLLKSFLWERGCDKSIHEDHNKKDNDRNVKVVPRSISSDNIETIRFRIEKIDNSYKSDMCSKNGVEKFSFSRAQRDSRENYYEKKPIAKSSSMRCLPMKDTKAKWKSPKKEIQSDEDLPEPVKSKKFPSCRVVAKNQPVEKALGPKVVSPIKWRYVEPQKQDTFKNLLTSKDEDFIGNRRRFRKKTKLERFNSSTCSYPSSSGNISDCSTQDSPFENPPFTGKTVFSTVNSSGELPYQERPRSTFPIHQNQISANINTFERFQNPEMNQNYHIPTPMNCVQNPVTLSVHSQSFQTLPRQSIYKHTLQNLPHLNNMKRMPRNHSMCYLPGGQGNQFYQFWPMQPHGVNMPTQQGQLYILPETKPFARYHSDFSVCTSPTTYSRDTTDASSSINYSFINQNISQYPGFRDPAMFCPIRPIFN